ncbi:hypothetical protein LIER_38912 [Lithospermum erythrorhizon]|uniref:Uncharacterized protein n=1 Tax=Lithospermum erythrorhizon TaxID=34254 RepID=A0AAV3Q922_LITER
MDILAQIQSLSNQLNELYELQNNKSRSGYPTGRQYDNGYPSTNSFYVGNQSWDPYYDCPPRGYNYDYPPHPIFEQEEHFQYLQWQKEYEEHQRFIQWQEEQEDLRREHEFNRVLEAYKAYSTTHRER